MLWFFILSDRTQVYLGDENSLSLTFNARNEGEGGAYEAELYVALPPEADYSGIARNNVVRQTIITVITRLSVVCYVELYRLQSDYIRFQSDYSQITSQQGLLKRNRFCDIRKSDILFMLPRA